MKKLFNMPAVTVPENVALEMLLFNQKAAIDEASRRLEAIEIIDGHRLKGIELAATTNVVINHKLGRQIRGWKATDRNAAATIHRVTSAGNEWDDKTLTLYASAAVTVDLWVF